MSESHMLNKTTTRASKFANVLLLAISLMLTFVMGECGYRFFLQRSTLLTYNATNKPLYEYSSSEGYAYVPNTDAVCVYVRTGRLFTYDHISVGPYGNLGNGVHSWGENDFKILVFGDSFTANPYKYFSWSEHIAEPLSKTIGKNVEVMNLARDGFGVLHLMRLANNTLKHTPADLVVIAFIVDDLDRARSWRTKLNINGMERTLMSIQPPPSPDLVNDLLPTTDIVLVNPNISEEWCKTALSTQRKDDPVLAALDEQCRRLVPQNFREDFSSFKTSFLFNRIRYGDPFQTVRNLPAMPRIDFQDYRQDAEFVEDVKSIMNQPVPVLMVLLPWYPEFKAGKHILSDQRKSLLESLNVLTQGRIVSALDYFEHPQEDIESMFFLPEDFHPAKNGAERYAKAIVKAIQARWNFRESQQSKQHARVSQPSSLISRKTASLQKTQNSNP